jgi:protein TonB
MSKTKFASSFIASLFIAATGSAIAGEVPATFDSGSCKVDYPKSSLMNEEQGVTAMAFLVNPDGSVAESKMEKSSGSKTLDNAALKTITSCKFKPGSKDGAPAKTWTKVAYAWKLD